ncbi:MAG: RagB/SusD family nutrient uptake outer membrane protein [Paludibacteraceae bacterium]
MKTHTIKIVASLLLISTVLISCESFLQEETYSFVSGEDFYVNETNAELGLTGIYSVLNATNIQEQTNQALWGRGIHYLLMHGDEIVGNLSSISDASHKEIASLAYNSESTFVSKAWFALYVGVNRANQIIEYVPSIKMDSTRKSQIVAEARFFRGFYELYLTWLFGAIPLPSAPESDIYLPRRSVKDVYASIISDLDYAYKSLPGRNTQIGRIDKWTAAGFLTKVYTYLGACKTNNVGADLNFELNSFDWVNADDCYTKAETLAQDIYDNGGYVLQNPVYKAFLADTKEYQKKECLMVVQAGQTGSNNYYLFAYLTGPQGNIGVNGGNYGWMRPVGELCAKYNAQDSRFFWNIQGNLGGTTYTSINGAKYFTPYTVNGNGSNLCLTKFRQSAPSLRTEMGMPTWASNIDFPILRFSDIMLLLAEAKYMNGDESGARELLVEVRKRACTNGTTVDQATLTTLNSIYHKSDFMEELMDERSRELCGESWRRIDLIRMGKFVSTLKGMKREAQAGSPYYYYNSSAATVADNLGDDSHKIWYPIPKREIAVNSNLVPNPGY